MQVSGWDAVKFFEDSVTVTSRNTDARIRDKRGYFLVVALKRHSNLSALRGVLDRVGNQVCQSLADPVRIADHRQPRLGRGEVGPAR